MIDDSLQFQIHNGSQEAFLEMSRLCAKDIYLAALGASGEETLSRIATKNALLRFRRALIASEGPVDSDAMLSEFLEEELGMPLYPLPAIPDTVPSPSSPEPSLTRGTEFHEPVRPSRPSKPKKASVSPRQKPDERKKEGPVQMPRFPLDSVSQTDRWIFVFSVFSVFCMIWAIIGILMDLSVFPRADFGYRWFNRYLFPLFRTF